MTKRILSALLAVLMVLTMFTACDDKKENAELDIDISVLDGLEYPLCSEEPLTLTAFYGSFVGETVQEGKLKGEETIYAVAAERTNIHLVTTVGKDQDAKQAFNLMLLDETLPDIIKTSLANANAAGYTEGALVDLKPYVTNPDIMPNLSKIYEEHPEYLAALTAPDGAVYLCSKLREEGPTQAWFTRQDWMDKLGLEHPKTFDDFVAVMDAFLNQDPNGNGKKDEVPLFGLYTDLFYFFGMNGYRYWDLDENDQMYTPMTTEIYKNALISLADWYAKGYIDQEIFTRKNPRSELWGNNIGGMTCDWFSSTMSYNTQIKNVPGFHVSVMMPPENIFGQAYCHSPGAVVSGSGWAISKDNKHIAETLRYFDYWYSDEGSCLNAMGIEGRDWLPDENGNPKYTEKATHYEGGAPQYVRDIGCVDIGYYMRQKWLLSGMTEEAKAGNQAYIDADFTCKLIPKYNFTDEEQEVIDEKWTSCQTYIDEYMQKAILGQYDVNETWDAYVAQLKKFGIDDVQKVHNSAYGRYVQLLKELEK